MRRHPAFHCWPCESRGSESACSICSPSVKARRALMTKILRQQSSWLPCDQSIWLQCLTVTTVSSKCQPAALHLCHPAMPRPLMGLRSHYIFSGFLVGSLRSTIRIISCVCIGSNKCKMALLSCKLLRWRSCSRSSGDSRQLTHSSNAVLQVEMLFRSSQNAPFTETQCRHSAAPWLGEIEVIQFACQDFPHQLVLWCKGGNPQTSRPLLAEDIFCRGAKITVLQKVLE